MKIILDNRICGVEIIYLAIYFANLILNFCSIYMAYIPEIVRSCIGFLIMLVGGVLVIRNIVYVIINRIKIPKSFLFLLGLLVLMGISCFANLQYGFIGSLKIIVWSSILFFEVFPFFYCCDKSSIYKEFAIIVLPGFIIWALMICVSLSLFYMNIQEYELIVPEYIRPRYLGIHNNRLVGVFNDASMGSTLSWFMALIALFLAKSTQKLPLRFLCVVVVVLAIQYIVATGARSSLVVVIVSFAIFVWFIIRKKFFSKAKRKALFQIGTFVGVCACSVVLVIACFSLVQTLMVEVAQSISNNGTASITETNVSTVDEKSDVTEISLERTDLNGKDITNLRLDLWGDALRAFLDKPLFGTSIDGFIPYVKETYPESFAARGYDVGNGYLAVLVYGGILSGLLMIAFVITQCGTFYHWLKNVQLNTPLDYREYLFLVILVGIAISAAINMDIFYINYSSTFIFWLLLGALHSFNKLSVDIQHS